MKPPLPGLLIAAALMTGCMVGPKYSRPAAAVTPGYKEPPPDTFRETKDWKTVGAGQPLPGKWWQVFGDARLNSLEEQVALANQDLKVAEARFREARAMVRLNRAAQFPTISVGPGERYTVLFNAAQAGVWVWHCHILNHAENDEGMFGMVTAVKVD